MKYWIGVVVIAIAIVASASFLVFRGSGGSPEGDNYGEWQLIETWNGTVQAPAEWQVVETWTGTVNVTISVVENDILLTVKLEKTEFDLGENVAITLTVKNMGENRVTLTFPDFMPNIAFDFVIYDEELNQIYVHRTGIIFTIAEIILDPGQSYTEVLEWAQERFDEMQEPTPVGPGTYWLKGRLREGWWGKAEGPKNRSALETNLIKFVVTSKE